jgi:hypothetical protein
MPISSPSPCFVRGLLGRVRPHLFITPVMFTLLLLISPSAMAQMAASVTGSGHYEPELNNPDEDLRTFSFSVVVDKDGSVSGMAQVKNRKDGFKAHLDIDCVNIKGNKATIGGWVTKSTFSERLGLPVLFILEENGEGENSLPDRITPLYGFEEGFPAPHCSTVDPTLLTESGLPLPQGFPRHFNRLRMVEKGNIQLHIEQQ